MQFEFTATARSQQAMRRRVNALNRPRGWPALFARFRAPRASASASENVELTVDKGGLRWDAEHSSVVVDWSGVHTIDVYRGDVIFILDLLSVHLPREAFASDAQRLDFVAQCRAYRAAMADQALPPAL